MVKKAVVCLILDVFANKFDLCVLIVNEVQDFVLRVVPAIKLKISIIHELSEVSLPIITSGYCLLYSPLITESVFFLKRLVFKTVVKMYLGNLPSSLLCKNVNVVNVHREPVFREKDGVCFLGSFVL